MRMAESAAPRESFMTNDGRWVRVLAVLASVIGGNGFAHAQQPARTFGAVDDQRLLDAEREPQNWLTYGGTYFEQRYSTLEQINVDTVSRLKPAWSFDFDTTRGQEATPLVVDGVMYTTTAWSKVYALDAKTGRQLWRYDPQVPGEAGPKPCCDVVNRGAAVYRGRVYVGTVDGRLIALDARTGKLAWSVLTVDPKRMHSITGAPRVARGKVFIGNGGGEFGGRGYVSAYDVATGKLVWRFYTVPADPAKGPDHAASDEVLESKARKTWVGPWAQYTGGGHAWNAIVFDPQLKQVYLATGNGFPMNPNYRAKGDNLFIASIVALDADTGKYVWHYQETPGDAWDYDAVQDMTLADLTLAGERHSVLMHASKNGFFYVIDRHTGQLLSANAFVPGVNWATRVDLATGRPQVVENAHYENGPFTGSPGEGGAHGWQPQSFSPKTGLVYLPAGENSTLYVPTPTYEFVDGLDSPGIFHGATHGAQPAPTPASRPGPAGKAVPYKSYLLAWNPATGKPAWRAEVAGGGTLVTAGNLVFQGRSRETVMGEIAAFRADDGRQVWSYRTPNAVMAGPVTYEIDHQQYVAFVSGAGGAGIIAGGASARARQVGRVLAFKLDGAGTLPPDPPPAPPLVLPSDTWTAAVIDEGKDHYARLCGRCHGLNMMSSNIVPDLRRSAALADRAAWKAIVLDGALRAQGMVSWSKFLSPDAAESVRAYVADEARKASAATATR
jgi:quinohemoprotein ethanol dehydrogenase